MVGELLGTPHNRTHQGGGVLPDTKAYARTFIRLRRQADNWAQGLDLKVKTKAGSKTATQFRHRSVWRGVETLPLVLWQVLGHQEVGS